MGSIDNGYFPIVCFVGQMLVSVDKLIRALSKDNVQRIAQVHKGTLLQILIVSRTNEDRLKYIHVEVVTHPQAR